MASSSVPLRFRSLANAYWDFLLREDPRFATRVGDHRFDDRLPEASERAQARRLARLRTFRERARAIPRSRLSGGDRLNLDILTRALEDRIRRIEFHAYRMPISKTGGFHATFAELPLTTRLASRRDYENFISRIRGFPRFVEDHIDVMRAGLREGQVHPRTALVGVGGQVRAQIVDDPEKSPPFAPMRKFPESIPEAARPGLAKAGRQAIRDAAGPGYEALLRFLEDEYLPGAREDIAATALPDGPAYYAFCIRLHTTLERTPEEIHEIGLAEVRRLRGEMDALIRRAGFTGSFHEFVEFLRTDPGFYATTPEDLLKETASVLKRMDGELPTMFRVLPRMPYGMRVVPDFRAPHTTTAYYEQPSGDGTKAGFYYVNTYDLRSRPLYEIEALSLHEAVPGHHLQIGLQQELDLPPWRRFTWFTAFVEGWALYAERLGIGRGFYEDPYSDFARLSYEMWRACRLVVDTGMHALGWTRDKAIEHMAENTSLTRLNIENEVDRYIAWPGQALAYKMGELTITRLRATAEKALGERFDLREFHDIVLREGAVPLEVLEDQVNRWINGQIRRNRGRRRDQSSGA